MSDIDDPFKPSDATIVRPRPGGGRRRPTDPPAQPRYSPPPRDPEPGDDPAMELPLVSGLNPLVQGASGLLLLAGQLRGSLQAHDVGGLKRQALDDVRRFEERARDAGISKDTILAARYILCACLDEAVLSTPWGAQSEWSQQSLLVTLHREAWGGEKFFDMLERISQDPARHIDLMELQYLCIAMGFAGKYSLSDRDRQQLADIQRSLYQRIRDHRGVPRQELSLRWQGVKDRRHRLIRYVPWWFVGSAVLATLAVAFVTYRTLLGEEASQVKNALSEVRRKTFDETVKPTVVNAPTLRSQLEGLAQLLILDGDQDGITTVHLPTTERRSSIVVRPLFASGSDVVDGEYSMLLERIAQALNTVPGQVRVIGHTDDQPVSSRFNDNTDLSMARARSVVGILSKTVDPRRLRADIDPSGKQLPRDSGLSTEENRARNRYVEIVHVRGS